MILTVLQQLLELVQTPRVRYPLVSNPVPKLTQHTKRCWALIQDSIQTAESSSGRPPVDWVDRVSKQDRRHTMAQVSGSQPEKKKCPA